MLRELALFAAVLVISAAARAYDVEVTDKSNSEVEAMRDVANEDDTENVANEVIAGYQRANIYGGWLRRNNGKTETKNIADMERQAGISSAPPAKDVTKQIANIVVDNKLIHYGGVHTIPTIGDPEYGVLKKFILTYGVVGEFECKDFQPVHISVPADRQLIVFSASYGSTSHPDRDVTQAVVKYLVKDNAINHDGGVHTAIGDPEPGVPKTFRIIYGYSQRFTCLDFQPVVISVEEGLSLHVFRATYGSANI